MPQIQYTIAGSSGGATTSIKKNSDPLERCISNCSGKSNGSYISTYNDVNLEKGVSHTMDLSITEGNCTISEQRIVCCPATGGSISGNFSPTQNSTQQYTVGGIVGTYAPSSGIGGFQTWGGNPEFTTPPTNGIATVNVGTQPFQLCFNLVSCGIERSICVDINPQTVGCTLSVANVSISC